MILEYELSSLEDNLNSIFAEIKKRLLENITKYTKHPSLEHTFMVLQEEMDELKEELYKKEAARSSKRICDETLDILAVATRLLVDHNLCCLFKKGI